MGERYRHQRTRRGIDLRPTGDGRAFVCDSGGWTGAVVDMAEERDRLLRSGYEREGGDQEEENPDECEHGRAIGRRCEACEFDAAVTAHLERVGE